MELFYCFVYDCLIIIERFSLISIFPFLIGCPLFTYSPLLSFFTFFYVLSLYCTLSVHYLCWIEASLFCSALFVFMVTSLVKQYFCFLVSFKIWFFLNCNVCIVYLHMYTIIWESQFELNWTCKNWLNMLTNNTVNVMKLRQSVTNFNSQRVVQAFI